MTKSPDKIDIKSSTSKHMTPKTVGKSDILVPQDFEGPRKQVHELEKLNRVLKENYDLQIKNKKQEEEIQYVYFMTSIYFIEILDKY